MSVWFGEFRDGLGPGLGLVYPNPNEIFYPWIFDFNTQLVPIPD